MSRFVLLVGVVLTARVAVADAPVPDHPLLPVMKIAYDGLQRMETEIQDYTCQLTKRERVHGRLHDPETMFLKVRHAQVQDGRVVTPFSVYVRFLSPSSLKGREVLWVEGRNRDKLIVRNGGPRFEYVTLALAPDSDLALQQNRYPLPEIGVMNLTRRLIDNGLKELQHRECVVKMAPGARINDRPCTLIQVSHDRPRENLIYQFVRILVDDQLQLPVYYTAYDWPSEPGGAPRLLEEYTYTDIRVNVGLTDWDFDHRNEAYQFLKSFEVK